jgi:hypothetical protein
MSTGLIRGLLFNCRHQFSWPRCDEAGEHYQVCVHCGTKYSYDWATMRRLAPLGDGEADLVTRPTPRRKCGTKKAWVPRDRRIRHQVPVLFRIAGSGEWMEGESDNISHTGLLFRSASPLDTGSALEVKLEMPHDLTGDGDAHVVCEGSLVRVETIPPTRVKKTPIYRLACSIKEYKFESSGGE